MNDRTKIATVGALAVLAYLLWPKGGKASSSASDPMGQKPSTQVPPEEATLYPYLTFKFDIENDNNILFRGTYYTPSGVVFKRVMWPYGDWDWEGFAAELVIHSVYNGKYNRTSTVRLVTPRRKNGESLLDPQVKRELPMYFDRQGIQAVWVEA